VPEITRRAAQRLRFYMQLEVDCSVGALKRLLSSGTRHMTHPRPVNRVAACASHWQAGFYSTRLFDVNCIATHLELSMLPVRARPLALPSPSSGWTVPC